MSYSINIFINNPSKVFLSWLAIIFCINLNFGREPIKDDTRLFTDMLGKENSDLMNSGITYLNRNELDSALVCFSLVAQNVHDCTTENDREYYLASLNGMGIVYFLFGNYAQSYSMFTKVLETDSLYVDVYHNLAAIHQLYGKHEEARRHLLNAYKIQINQGELSMAATAFVNIVNYDIHNGLLAESDSLIRTYRKFDVDSSDPIMEYANSLGDGAIFMIEGQPLEAIPFFRRLFNFKGNIDERLIVAAHLNMAKAFDQAGLQDSASVHFKESLYLSKSMHYDDISVDAGKMLADLYDREGRHEDAMKTRYDALLLSDSLQSFSEFDKIKSFELQSHVNRHEKQMAVKEAKSRIQTLFIIILSVISVILIILVFLLLTQRRKLRMKDMKIFEGLNREADTVTKSEETESQYSNPVEEERGNRLEEEIRRVIQDDSYVRSADFSLQSLSELVKDTSKNVSQIINLRFGKNFNQLVNERRIEMVLAMLKEAQFDNYTVDAIAEEVGFKSRSTFSRVFTSITGISPTAYRKLKGDKDKAGTCSAEQ